jgi:hypothetical protein
MLLPRTLSCSNEIGFLPFGISLTAFRCVFIAMSTPASRRTDHEGPSCTFCCCYIESCWAAGCAQQSASTNSRCPRDQRDGRTVCLLLSTCNLPVMVPEMTVPFFSSIWTTSFDNFIRNLH